jgi:hypothetical protein
MKKKALAAAVSVMAAVGVVGGGSAEAATPTDPPCLGEGFSAFASNFGSGFGQQISTLASNPELMPLADNFGEAIQNLQAGTAVLFPVCPPPD